LQDAAREITAELKGQPDLIIGNYSDGNLVASLISHKQGITQVFFKCHCPFVYLLQVEKVVFLQNFILKLYPFYNLSAI